MKQLGANKYEKHTCVTPVLKWVEPYRKATQTTSTEMPLWMSKFEDSYTIIPSYGCAMQSNYWN